MEEERWQKMAEKKMKLLFPKSSPYLSVPHISVKGEIVIRR
jgi:hypothetical protein